MTVREFLDTHPGAPWAALVLLVALWCVGAVFVGEPALDAPALPPARYVVEQPATVAVSADRAGLFVVEAVASTGAPTPTGDVGLTASTTPLDDPSAASTRGTPGNSTADGSSSHASEVP